MVHGMNADLSVGELLSTMFVHCARGIEFGWSLPHSSACVNTICTIVGLLTISLCQRIRAVLADNLRMGNNYHLCAE